MPHTGYTFALLGCYVALTDSYSHFRTTYWFHLEGSCSPISQNSYNIIYIVAEGRSHALYLTGKFSREVDHGLCMWRWHVKVTEFLAALIVQNSVNVKQKWWYSPHLWLSVLISSNYIPCCDFSFIHLFPFLLWLSRVDPDFVVWLCRLYLLHAYPNFSLSLGHILAKNNNLYALFCFH